MKNLKTSLLSAAVAGLLFGATSCTTKKDEPVVPPKGEAPKGEAPKAGGASKASPAALAVGAKEKHACAKRNTCEGKGGCKVAGANDCAGKNKCSGKGGCATVEHHGCGGKNQCRGQGGCGDKVGKNDCTGKGGCAVPVKH